MEKPHLEGAVRFQNVSSPILPWVVRELTALIFKWGSDLECPPRLFACRLLLAVLISNSIHCISYMISFEFLTQTMGNVSIVLVYLERQKEAVRIVHLVSQKLARNSHEMKNKIDKCKRWWYRTHYVFISAVWAF